MFERGEELVATVIESAWVGKRLLGLGSARRDLRPGSEVRMFHRPKRVSERPPRDGSGWSRSTPLGFLRAGHEYWIAIGPATKGKSLVLAALHAEAPILGC
jgi:hypothetical protein